MIMVHCKLLAVTSGSCYATTGVILLDLVVMSLSFIDPPVTHTCKYLLYQDLVYI